MTIYIFYRKDSWYPIALENDLVARENAELNPGTTKVENVVTREIVWQE